MNSKSLYEETTLALFGGLIQCKKEYASIIKAKWSFNPVRWFSRKSKKGRLAQESKLIAGELAKRYEGILLQMFRRGSPGATLTNEIWQEVQFSIWEQLRDAARTIADRREFSGALWNISEHEINQNELAGSLRPKFMLRQFVDEIPSSDERGVLRLMAYGSNDMPPQTGRELLDSIQRSLPALHSQLLLNLGDLPTLTDGEITAAMVVSFREPFTQYRGWLFPP